MPNSAVTAAATAPAVRSPAVSSSRMRRRTGSPRTSNGCTTGSYNLILIYVQSELRTDASPAGTAAGRRRWPPRRRRAGLGARRVPRGRSFTAVSTMIATASRVPTVNAEHPWPQGLGDELGDDDVDDDRVDAAADALQEPSGDEHRHVRSHHTQQQPDEEQGSTEQQGCADASRGAVHKQRLTRIGRSSAPTRCGRSVPTRTAPRR